MTRANEIYECCNNCGKLANLAHAAVYDVCLPMAQISTYHHGVCPLCGRESSVTELRDFGYPDLKLVNWRSVQRARKESNDRKNNEAR